MSRPPRVDQRIGSSSSSVDDVDEDLDDEEEHPDEGPEAVREPAA
jgi:hypothetical protein